MTVDCISRLSGPVRLALRYTTADIHCRDRQEYGIGTVRKPNKTGSLEDHVAVLEKSIKRLNRVSIRVRVSFRVSIRLSAI